MKVFKNIVRFILIAILVICIISVVMIKIFSSTILDKEYTVSKLEENNFYEETYKSVESNFENYIYQSGLDEKVLQNICTEEDVKRDINIVISNLYAGTQKEIDTSDLESKLRANIEEDIKITSSNEESINQFIAQISEEYKDTILHTNYEDKINSVYIKVIKMIDKVYEVLIGVIIVTVISLMIARKFVKSVGTALTAAGLFNIISYNVIINKVNVEGIKILNDTFSNIVVSILKEILHQIMMSGIISVVIGLVLIIIYSIISAIFTKNKDERSNEEV